VDCEYGTGRNHNFNRGAPCGIGFLCWEWSREDREGDLEVDRAPSPITWYSGEASFSLYSRLSAIGCSGQFQAATSTGISKAGDKFD
jgi:hypothetical protein